MSIIRANPARRLTVTVSLTLGLLCSNRAQAHSPGGAGEFLLSVAGLIAPNTGVDMLTQPSHDAQIRVRLSWQFAIPVVDWSSYRNGDPMHHRVVIGPELLLPNGIWGGRVGYRFVFHPLFLGAGSTFSGDLGPAGSVEVGWRFFSFTKAPDFRNSAPNFFAVLRADSPLRDDFGKVWASSLCIGLGFR